ncbi:TELO2-interacting protein 2 [Aplochiton taeniatus]
MLPLLPMLAPMCCVFAVTHFQEQAWSKPGSRDAGSSLLRTLLRAGGWRDSGQLLCGKSPGDDTGILAGVLDILQPDLTKERWLRNEAVKQVFSWTLLQVGCPSLAKQLDRVFPASLLISDHHRLDNQLLGVRCLHHIVLSTPAADLRQYNRAQVLYHAMFNRLYTAEPQLIQVVLLCLLDLLPVLERPPSSSSNSGTPRKPGHYDDVLRLVLIHMEMEHKVVLRRVYASCLPLFVDIYIDVFIYDPSRMGIAVVRHLKRLERVVTGYLEIPDPQEEQARLAILDTLEKTIIVAWPRMECRLGVLVRSLLRLLCDVSEEPLLAPPVKKLLMDKASRCLLLLDHCTHGKLQPLFQEVDSTCASASILKSLEKIIDVSKT